MPVMYNNRAEYTQIIGGVLSYLQRDIDKLFDYHDIDAEFMNFESTEVYGYPTTWVYFKVYYTWYNGPEDEMGNYDEVKVGYAIDTRLFVRNDERMQAIDRWANLAGKQNKLSDVDLVKLRVLYSILMICQSIQEDNLPGLISLPTKKWLKVENNNDGGLVWDKVDHAPGGKW